MKRALLAAFLLALVECGGSRDAPATHPQAASGPKPVPVINDASRRPLTRHAAIQFNRGGRASWPIPLLRGTIGGVSTWMIVDTGATSHAIAGWFAKKHGLGMTKLDGGGTDHAGRPVVMHQIESVTIELEEWGPLPRAPMLVFEMPDLIEKLGIGMFISPQGLVDEGDAVLLDLKLGELKSAWFDEALAGIATRGRDLAPSGAQVCTESGPIKGLSFVLRADIQGKPARLLVDTGAEHSDLFESSAAGKALLPSSVVARGQVYGASGQLHARTAKGAIIAVGDHRLTSDVSLIPGGSDPSCPRDGVLSMDALRSCVLLLGRTRMAGRCLAAN